MIQCIIKRHQGEASDEHIIPESIGGKLITRKVCVKCNNDYCSKLDAALVEDRIMLFARNQFKIPGYDVENKVFGKGKLQDGTDVVVKFDKNLEVFVPEIRGGKTKTERGDGTADIAWTLPHGTQPEDLLKAVRKELEKNGEIGLSDAEVLSRMNFQEKTIVRPTVNLQMTIDLIALTLAGLKIAYEYTAETIGYKYLKDAAADKARDFILAGLPSDPAERESFSCELGGLRFSGSNNPTSQHKLMLCRRANQLIAAMSLFDTFIGVYTMSENADEYAPLIGSIHQIDVLNGQRIDYRIPSQP